jgi:HEAT repeat protein
VAAEGLLLTETNQLRLRAVMDRLRISQASFWFGIGLMGLLLVFSPPGYARAEKNLSALIQDLQSKDSRIRVRAAYVLGNMGPKAREAAPALIQAVRSNSESAYQNFPYFVNALIKTGQNPIAILIRAVRDRDYSLSYGMA